MGSRTYSLLITPDEWCEVIQSVKDAIGLHGVLHQWPDHRYKPLDIGRLRSQIQEDNAFKIVVRAVPLDSGVALKCFVDAYPASGMVCCYIPQILPGRRLQGVDMAMRAEDAVLRGIADPTPLYQALLKRWKRISLKPVIWKETNEPIRSVYYTRGALELFEQGYEWVLIGSSSLLMAPG